jgi:hypothetical protein
MTIRVRVAHGARVADARALVSKAAPAPAVVAPSGAALDVPVSFPSEPRGGGPRWVTVLADAGPVPPASR